ncbi:TonB-dependent receptor [Horticoccus sp. 23ND18S-11]|uniref:TonB-dependent receptor n=1 Tax=Horticoccus sp. 23ND18S-11 TaxID=3391832 RepID=UPI0039C93F15
MLPANPLLRLAGVLIAFFLAFSVPPRLAAQSTATGVIEGRVSHSAGGLFLKQVRIVVEGSALETFTNEAGEFRLAGVPAGSATLRATVAGFAAQTARVSLAAGQTVRHDFDLGASDAPVPNAAAGDQTVMLDKFTVAERELSAQAAALQEQRIAPNIKNVVAFEEFGDLGDGNPGEFLKFVPGIQVSMNPAIPGEATIRGMPGSGTILTVDGVELSTDSPSTRGAVFSASNVANMDRIEVTKVPTPDMPANAVGGMINVVGKSGFARRDPQLTYSVFGLLTTIEPLSMMGRELFRSGGADKSTDGPHVRPGFDVTYIRPFGPQFALTVSLGHNARWEDKDNLAPTWNRVALIQTQSAIAAQIAVRDRNVASVRADWRPARGHSLFATFQYTSDDVHTRIGTYTQAYGANATGGENFTQGAAANAAGVGAGTTTLANTYREQLKSTRHVALGHRGEFSGWKTEATVAYSHSRRETLSAQDGYEFFGTVSANLTGLVLRADNFGQQRLGTPPTVRGTRAGQAVDVTDGRLYTLNSVTSPQEPLMTSDLTTLKLNASRPLGFSLPVVLKAGFDYSRAERDIRAETRTWNFRPTFAANTPERLVGSYDLINWAYSNDRSFRNGDRVKWIDPRKVYDLYKANPAYFVLNDAAYHTSRVNGSQKLEETVSAGYLRADAKLLENRLWFVGGVRYERTDDEGTGALNDVRATYQQDASGNLIRNAAGQLVRVSTDVLTIARLQYKERGSFGKKNYDGYYPSFNASYSFTENFVARAAYASTIGRPDLNFIIPSRTVADPSAAENNRVINTTNAGLKPWSADNYDLSIESYGVKGATIAVSLFRKDITGFFVTTRSDATLPLLTEMGLSDDYLDYDVITTTNSNNAVALSGIEWSWRQSLKPFAFLPTWTRGVQVWCNGTHLRLSGAGQDDFSGYSPRILNWGASYATARFLLKYNVSRISRQRASLDTVSATVPAGTYQAQDTRMVMDGSVEYRFHRRFAVYASVRNLANEPRPLITYSPNAPAYTRPRTYTYYGALWTMGVKGTF